MSLFVILNGADVGATTVRLRSGGENGIPGLTTSANGVGSMGGIVFDDPSSALTVQGWMPITVDEPDCVGASRIGTGYVGDRTYERGPYLTGTGRHIDTTIYDPMALLSFLLITGEDGKRPAETHIDTIDWLLGSAYLPPNTIYDLGLVDRSHPRPFQAADYRGQYAADVLNAIAGPIFQTFFLVWDQSAHKLSLFFDSPVATTNTASLTISNVPADVNNTTCFYPSKDAKLGVDPSSVYAKVRYTYRHGTTITNRPATATLFFGALGYRGVQVNNDRVGLTSTARTSSENLLDQYGEEAETLTFTVQLPSTKVGLIDAGMRLGVRFQHLPGYTSLTYVRVEGRTIMQSEGTDKQYDVQLTCSNHGLTTALGGGDPGGFPFPPPVVHSSCPTTLTTFTEDGEWHCLRSLDLGGSWPAGTVYDFAWTSHTSMFCLGNGKNCLFRTTLGSAEDGPDVTSIDDQNFSHTLDSTAGAQVHSSSGAGLTAADAVSFLTLWVKVAPSAAGCGDIYTDGLSTLTFTRISGGAFVAGSPDDTGPPLKGQWVYGEIPTPAPDGATVLFTLAYPYVAGSLKVRVDGVPILNGLTETDPDAGTFTLDFAPLGASGDTRAEIIDADYQSQ